MRLLPRLRYILEVVRPSPRVVQDVLEILTRVARHSTASATQVKSTFILLPLQSLAAEIEIVWSLSEPLKMSFPPQVLDCPRLMETVLSESLSLSPPHSVDGLPLASAMKLLRVLATAGRHACARLVSHGCLCHSLIVY